MRLEILPFKLSDCKNNQEKTEYFDRLISSIIPLVISLILMFTGLIISFLIDLNTQNKGDGNFIFWYFMFFGIMYILFILKKQFKLVRGG